jgi:hypothetical protein
MAGDVGIHRDDPASGFGSGEYTIEESILDGTINISDHYSIALVEGSLNPLLSPTGGAESPIKDDMGLGE